MRADTIVCDQCGASDDVDKAVGWVTLDNPGLHVRTFEDPTPPFDACSITCGWAIMRVMAQVPVEPRQVPGGMKSLTTP